METGKIGFLCRLSDEIHRDAEKATGSIFKKELKNITINSGYSNIVFDFDTYPELKAVAEKLLDYLVKSESSKQNEIKIEIAKCL